MDTRFSVSLFKKSFEDAAVYIILNPWTKSHYTFSNYFLSVVACPSGSSIMRTIISKKEDTYTKI